MDQDRDHLKLLSIFHFVVGGMAAFFGCFPLVHMFLGIAWVSGGLESSDNAPDAAFGWLFIAIATFLIAAFWTMAAFILRAGYNLQKYQNYNFCVVVACVECTIVPLGTVLGIFTLIVLMRPSVKQLFGVPLPPATPAGP